MSTRVLRLRAQVIHATVVKEERFVRLVWWNTSVRQDATGTHETARIPFSDDARTVSDPFDIALPVRADTTHWGRDETFWVQAASYVHSEDGPVVGGRDGCGSIAFADLRDAVEAQRRSTDGRSCLIDIPIVLQLPGTGRKPRQRMVVRLLSVTEEETSDAIRGWTFDSTEMIGADIDASESALSAFVNVNMFAFTDAAAAHGVAFRPSRKSVGDIHAPLYFANLPMPAFYFWTETGDHAPSPAMGAFLASLARASLARHGWTGSEAFVRLVDTQFARVDDTYDRNFTMAAVAVADTATIVSTSTYYRFDNLFVKRNKLVALVSGATSKPLDIESFHDALREAGGDCDDTAGQNHRVFRWLKMGRPEHADRTKYWKKYGGWAASDTLSADDAVLLDHMQRVAFWYVSGGQLSSVTASHIAQTDKNAGPLLVDSPQDRAAEIGGHLYCEYVPAIMVETLLKRTNSAMRDGALRPDAGYPPWMHRLPHLVGEGTGSVHPLVMPFSSYFPEGSDDAKWARAQQEKLVDATRFVATNTEVLGSLQIQRLPPRLDDIPGARATSFYRRTTSFFTDDLPLSAGIRSFEMMWMYTKDNNNNGAGAARQEDWAYGVNMRDKTTAARPDSDVALVMMPGPDDKQMVEFKARARHLCPWKQPQRSPARMQKLRARFAVPIREFNDRAARAARCTEANSTRVVVVFRRAEFLVEGLRERAITDVEAIGASLVGARAVLEDFDDEIFNVRLELDVVPSRAHPRVRARVQSRFVGEPIENEVLPVFSGEGWHARRTGQTDDAIELLSAVFEGAHTKGLNAQGNRFFFRFDGDDRSYQFVKLVFAPIDLEFHFVGHINGDKSTERKIFLAFEPELRGPLARGFRDPSPNINFELGGLHFVEGFADVIARANPQYRGTIVDGDRTDRSLVVRGWEMWVPTPSYVAVMGSAEDMLQLAERAFGMEDRVNVVFLASRLEETRPQDNRRHRLETVSVEGTVVRFWFRAILHDHIEEMRRAAALHIILEYTRTDSADDLPAGVIDIDDSDESAQQALFASIQGAKFQFTKYESRFSPADPRRENVVELKDLDADMLLVLFLNKAEGTGKFLKPTRTGGAGAGATGARVMTSLANPLYQPRDTPDTTMRFSALGGAVVPEFVAPGDNPELLLQLLTRTLADDSLVLSTSTGIVNFRAHDWEIFVEMGRMSTWLEVRIGGDIVLKFTFANTDTGHAAAVKLYDLAVARNGAVIGGVVVTRATAATTDLPAFAVVQTAATQKDFWYSGTPLPAPKIVLLQVPASGSVGRRFGNGTPSSFVSRNLAILELPEWVVNFSRLSHEHAQFEAWTSHDALAGKLRRAGVRASVIADFEAAGEEAVRVARPALKDFILAAKRGNVSAEDLFTEPHFFLDAEETVPPRFVRLLVTPAIADGAFDAFSASINMIAKRMRGASLSVRLELFVRIVEIVLRDDSLIRDLSPRLWTIAWRSLPRTLEKLNAYKADAIFALGKQYMSVSRGFEEKTRRGLDKSIVIPRGTVVFKGVGRNDPRFPSATAANAFLPDGTPYYVAFRSGVSLGYTVQRETDFSTAEEICANLGSIMVFRTAHTIEMPDMSVASNIEELRVDVEQSGDSVALRALDQAFAVKVHEVTGEKYVARSSIFTVDAVIAAWLCRNGREGYAASAFGEFPAEVMLCTSSKSLEFVDAVAIGDLGLRFCEPRFAKSMLITPLE